MHYGIQIWYDDTSLSFSFILLLKDALIQCTLTVISTVTDIGYNAFRSDCG